MVTTAGGAAMSAKCFPFKLMVKKQSSSSVEMAVLGVVASAQWG